MHALRTLLHRHRLPAVLVIVCALLLKAVVPAGFMLSQHGTVLTVEICADATGAKLTRQIVVPSTGQHEKSDEAQGKSPVCAYAGLSHAALAGADAVLLALALAFVLAVGLLPAPSLPLRRIPHVRPPLRGPPALA